MKQYEIQHLVKGEDQNHHGTLFAGQGAKWFVESGFVAAANMTAPENIVCVNIHGMIFKKAVPSGTIIRFESRVVLAGRTSIIAYVKVVKSRNEEFVVNGFLTFVHVDANGKPLPHGLSITAATEEEKMLQEKARLLNSGSK